VKPANADSGKRSPAPLTTQSVVRHAILRKQRTRRTSRKAVDFARQTQVTALRAGGGSKSDGSRRGCRRGPEDRDRGNPAAREGDAVLFQPAPSGGDKLVERGVANGLRRSRGLEREFRGNSAGPPFQNVGAYGQEVSQTIETVRGSTLEQRTRGIVRTVPMMLVALPLSYSLFKHRRPRTTYPARQPTG